MRGRWIRRSRATGPSVSALFGLTWGADQKAALNRFRGLAPVAQSDEQIEWLLFDIAERLLSERAFLPTQMRSAPERDADRVLLSFEERGLISVRLSFGYGFDLIGQDPDTLSDLAMAAYARAEMTDLLTQMACRHGVPAHTQEAYSRSGNWHIVGSAIYMRPDGGVMGLRFGHDVVSLVGDLTSMAPSR